MNTIELIEACEAFDTSKFRDAAHANGALTALLQEAVIELRILTAENESLREQNTTLDAKLAEQDAALAARGEVVITRNAKGHIVAVTRQNEEGQILKVLALGQDFYEAPQPAQQSGVNTPDWPTNAEQVRQFVGSNFCSLKYEREDHAPDGNDIYTMSAHDLISAIADWRDFVLEPAQPAEPVAWREHVEHRLRTWKQSFMNLSGDQLALDDFMDKDSLDDLVDYVCSEYEGPPPAQQPLTRKQQLDVFVKADARMQLDPELSWRMAIIEETEVAHGIGAKP